MGVVLHADVEHAPAGAVPLAVVDAVRLHVGVAALAFRAGREAFAVHFLCGLRGVVGIGVVDEEPLSGVIAEEARMAGALQIKSGQMLAAPVGDREDGIELELRPAGGLERVFARPGELVSKQV